MNEGSMQEYILLDRAGGKIGSVIDRAEILGRNIKKRLESLST